MCRRCFMVTSEFEGSRGTEAWGALRRASTGGGHEVLAWWKLANGAYSALCGCAKSSFGFFSLRHFFEGKVAIHSIVSVLDLTRLLSQGAHHRHDVSSLLSGAVHRRRVNSKAKAICWDARSRVHPESILTVSLFCSFLCLPPLRSLFFYAWLLSQSIRQTKDVCPRLLGCYLHE